MRRLVPLIVVTAVLAATATLLAASAASAPAPASGETCKPHPPIRIVEDTGPDGFILGHDPATGAPIYRLGSGVLAGDGSAQSPYVIEGWCIAPPNPVPYWTFGVDTTDRIGGIYLEGTDAHVRIQDNVIRGDAFDGAPSHVRQESGIRVHDAEHVSITGNVLTTSGTGVSIHDSPGTTVTHNTVTGNGAGLVLDDSPEVTVDGNTVANNGDGILLVDADRTTLERNTVTGNGANGIQIHGSAWVTLTENNIHDNGKDALEIAFGTWDTDARDNWWGDASGPSGGAEDACTGITAEGEGSRISIEGTGEICFDPWLLAPSPDAGPA